MVLAKCPKRTNDAIVSKGFPRNAHFLSAMFGRIVRNSTMEDSIMQTSAGVTRTKQCVPSSYHFIFEMIIISIDALRSSFSGRVLMTLKRASPVPNSACHHDEFLPEYLAYDDVRHSPCSVHTHDDNRNAFIVRLGLSSSKICRGLQTSAEPPC